MNMAVAQQQHQSYKIGTEKTGLYQDKQKQQPTDDEVQQLLQQLQQLIQMMVQKQMEMMGSGGGGDEKGCGGAKGAGGGGGGGGSVAALQQMLMEEQLKAMIKQQEEMNKKGFGGGQAAAAMPGGGGGGGGGAPAAVAGGGGAGGPAPAVGAGEAPPAYSEHPTEAPPAYSQTGEAPPAYSKEQVPAKIQVGDKMSGPQPKGMSDEQWSAAKEAGEATGMDPYILAAQAKQESRFGADKSGPSGGDGTWQVEPSTQQAYAGKFKEKFGHDYKHGDVRDEAKMAALIVTSKGSDDMKSNLMKYNGGDQYVAGQSKDSYGRPIEADKYAEKVMNYAAEMRAGG